MQQIEHITKRLKEIEQEKRELDSEYAMLVRIEGALSSHSHLLNSKDMFSHRSAAKFELLARVAEYLSSGNPLIYGGASTREIYNAIILSINEAAVQKSNYNNEQQRSGLGGEFDPGTPMINAPESMNYNTFRSYLTRFKKDGRIFFNEDKRRWRITKHERELSLPEEDDDKDYS